MKLHIHGVHVPNRKNTAELAALRLPIPETVEIPMSMHIGAPAIPVVKPGESVRVGQLIGKAGGFALADPSTQAFPARSKRLASRSAPAGGSCRPSSLPPTANRSLTRI